MARKPAPNRNPSFTATLPATNAPTAGTANVEYRRPELEKMLPKYALISDALVGSDAVKLKRKIYLPMPNSADQSLENQARYDAYLLRAVFYGISERTLAGMVGEVFNVEPTIKVPDLLDAVVKDAAGDGVPIKQQAKAAEEYLLAKGRAGLFVDYSTTDGETTILAQLEGTVRPYIKLYAPEAIINWRKSKVGKDVRYTLIVLQESYENSDDGFAVEVKTQYRVLRLVGGVYVQELWRGDPGAWSIYETYAPVDSTGARLTEIPFKFLGSVDNTDTIDQPPMYAICDLNIAHYRNSADYEESVFITGQATPVLSGLTQQWVTEVLKGRVELGSRAAIMLPTGASAELLQQEERSTAYEAMEHKERLMVMLGAKLVEQKTVQRTAKEAGQEKAAETSVLKTITDNVSEGYRWALEWCAIFQGITTVATDAITAMDSPNAIVFKLNTDFDIAQYGPEQANAAVNLWQKEAITWAEMRSVTKKAGISYVDDTTAQAEINQAVLDAGGSLLDKDKVV